MSEHSRFHLIQMETALRRRGLADIVMDDDGGADLWLDVETPDHLLVVRWLEDGFEVDVSDLQGNVEFQIQKAASVEAVLGILVDKKIVPDAQ